MTTYVTAQINIHDREKYAHYEQGFMEIFAAMRARCWRWMKRQRCGKGSGPIRERCLLSFRQRRQPKPGTTAPEYQQLATHRWAGSTANIALLEGVAAPTSGSKASSVH